MKAQKITGITWNEDGNTASFQNERLFGVTDGAGRWVSWDGVRPAAYPKKGTASEIAETCDADAMVWVSAR